MYSMKYISRRYRRHILVKVGRTKLAKNNFDTIYPIQYYWSKYFCDFQIVSFQIMLNVQVHLYYINKPGVKHIKHNKKDWLHTLRFRDIKNIDKIK